MKSEEILDSKNKDFFQNKNRKFIYISELIYYFKVLNIFLHRRYIEFTYKWIDTLFFTLISNS